MTLTAENLENELVEPLQNVLRDFIKSSSKINDVIEKTTNKLMGLNGSSDKEESSPSSKLAESFKKFSDSIDSLNTIVQAFLKHDPFGKAKALNQPINESAESFNYTGKKAHDYIDREWTYNQALARASYQSTPDIAEALKKMVKGGMSEKESDSLRDPVAKMATAYNFKPSDIADTALMLKSTLGVAVKDMTVPLDAIAKTANEIGQPLSSFSSYLSELSKNGVNFNTSHQKAFASETALVATIRAHSGSDNEATKNTEALFKAINGADFATKWAKALPNANLKQIEATAKKNGEDPVAAIMNYLHNYAPENGDKRAKALKVIFGKNDLAKSASSTLLNNYDHYQRIDDHLTKITAGTIQADFNTGNKSDGAIIRNLQEAFDRFYRTIGKDGMPVLQSITNKMNMVNDAFDWLDKHCEGVTTTIIAMGAVVMALGVGIQIVNVVMGVFNGIMAILGVVAGILESPLLIAVAIIGLIGLGIYELWQHCEWFRKSIKSLVDSIASYLPSSWFGHKKKHADEKEERNERPPLPKLPNPADMMKNMPGMGNLASLQGGNLAKMPAGLDFKNDNNPALAHPLSLPTTAMGQQNHLVTIKVEAEGGTKATAWSNSPSIQIAGHNAGSMVRRA